MTSYSPPVPVKIRTARKRHECSDCQEPIMPGDRYELQVSPPNRDEYGPRDCWLAWKSHAPRTGPEGEHLLGCDVAAAYREHEERERANGQ